MAMGQQKDRQGDLMVGWSEMPRSAGHVFYDRLQSVLIEGGFDGFAEAASITRPGWERHRCRRGAISGCTWWATSRASALSAGWNGGARIHCRCGSFCGCRAGIVCRTAVEDPHAPAPRGARFDWVLALIAEAGLVQGDRIGVDASTMEANAALRNIVRRDTGEGYRQMLEHMAQESGIETPTAEDLARLDRKRKGKKLSNQDWVSKSDPEARIAKIKDGTTQARARGGSGHRRGGGGRAAPRR